MASRHSRGPWHAVIRKTRAGHRVLEVRNTKGAVAIVYTDESDTRVLAAAKRLLGSLKHLVAIVRMHEGELRSSEKAKLEAAEALIAEVTA